MHDTGLSNEEWELIRSVLAAHPELTQVKLFGSRAKGNAKPGSEIDLAFLGEVDALQAQSIQAELEVLPLPYKFDVQPYASIRHIALREHIDRVGRYICPVDLEGQRV